MVGEGGVGELGGWCRCVGGEGIGGGGALKGGVEDGDDVVDAAHAAAVAELLGRREAPRDFPGGCVSYWCISSIAIWW